MSLLIVGCGYVGRAVASLWQSQGESVLAVTRGGAAGQELQAMGIVPLTANWLESNWHIPLTAPPPRVALVAVPHRAESTLEAQTHVVGLKNLMRAVPSLERVVVLSTTGVYHQNDGSEVDEQSPTEPTRIGPQIALAAERWVEQNLPGGRGCALRLAGIYGPGRVPLVAKLRAHEAIPTGQGWLNLIHRDDIARAVVALLKHPSPPPLYVLSDGQPVERRQFYIDAARIFETPPPLFASLEDSSASPSRSARGETNKRVCPKRILNDLSLLLQFPNHLAGLSAIARLEKQTRLRDSPN